MAYSKNRRLAEIVSDTSGNLSVEGIVVPTQSSSDNDTSAASTAFVHAHIDAVLDSAPGTLNTLNEIAAALNDDANFNTTVTNAIAAKLPLAGGTMTGTIAGFTSTGIDDNADSVAITIDSNENIGIGETSPTRRLSVRRDTGITSGFNDISEFLDSTLGAGGSISLNIGKAASNKNLGKMAFKWAGNASNSNALNFGFFNNDNLMTLTAAGNFGIGTTNPSAKLHVANAATEEYIFETTSNNTRSQVEVKSKDNSGNAIQTRISSMGDGAYGMLYTLTNHNLTFATNNAAPQMTLNTSGKVGIGTSSPANNLHIHTDSGDEGLTIKSTGDTSNAIIIDANRGNAGAAINALTGKWNGTSVADILFLTGADTTNKDDGVITFRTSSADNIAERMRINSVGEVGIRTTSLGAEATLHIGKPSGASNAEGGQLVLQSSTDGSLAPHFDAYTNASVDYLRLLKGTDTASSAVHTSFDLTNVRVGIGVSAPATSLHIANAGNSFLTLERTGTSGGTGKFGINMEGGSSQQTTMAYDDGGKLIIGRSSDPATQAGFNNDFILKGGFVGIKTLDPQVELHVTGNANISGSTTTGGVITGNHIIRSDAGHSTARVEAVYDDGAAQYDSNILMWVSEPGYTYDSGGIGVNVHASGHYYGRKYDNDYAVFTRFIKSDGSIQFAQNQGTSGTAGASQTETLKILADGKLRLATTGGIGFGTTNAANLLDDYEEGNFTPTFAASGGTAPSSQTGTGQYTKIGDVVHITGQINWNGAGSGGSNLYISIPFNLISDARAGLAIGLNSGVNYPQDHTLHLVPEINTNVIYLVSTHYSVSGHSHLSYSNISNTGSKLFSFSGSFHTRD